MTTGAVSSSSLPASRPPAGAAPPPSSTTRCLPAGCAAATGIWAPASTRLGGSAATDSLPETVAGFAAAALLAPACSATAAEAGRCSSKRGTGGSDRSACGRGAAAAWPGAVRPALICTCRRDGALKGNLTEAEAPTTGHVAIASLRLAQISQVLNQADTWWPTGTQQSMVGTGCARQAWRSPPRRAIAAACPLPR